jgi:uncharacterized protein (DUF488 family)
VLIYTIGHSTRTLEQLVRLLEAHDVGQLADIRTIPKSRRHPHFSRDALAESLPKIGIAYRHFGGLGGMRKPRADSRNGGWRHPSFRGYADYMDTPEFEAALDDLIGWARRGEARRPRRHTAIMCAEAVWWRCHRQLTADALVARGVEVRHITSTSAAPAHELTEFARVDGARVSYPGLGI